jgi:ABC-type branched-subunit amino acid transport system substrate-binding protein
MAIRNESIVRFCVMVLVAFLMLSLLPLAQRSQAATKELKIGSLLNLRSPEGVEVQKWLQLFVKMYNEQGGWTIGGEKHRVKLMVYDCGTGDVSKTRTAAERAVLQDRVKFLLCNWGDVPAEVVTITEPNKVLWMGVDLANTTVDPKLNYVVRGEGIFFGMGLPFTVQKDAVAHGAKTVVIVNPDNEFGKKGMELWSTSAKIAGLKVVDTILFPMSTADFGPLATKIKNLNPDYVQLPYVSGDQCTNIIGALKDAGFKGMVYPGNINPFVLENIVKKVGKSYVEGWESVYFDPKGILKDQEIVALMDRYVKEYGTWHPEGCFWVGSWFLFKDAVEKTQSTNVDILVRYLKDSKAAVRTFGDYSQLVARPDVNNFKTVDVAAGLFIGTIKDGKLRPLKPVSVKDHYLVSVKAYGLVDIYEKYWAQHGRPVFPPQHSLFDFSDLKK